MACPDARRHIPAQGEFACSLVLSLSLSLSLSTSIFSCTWVISPVVLGLQTWTSTCIIVSPGSQFFRFAQELHRQLSWTSSLQTADVGTSQHPQPCEPVPHNTSVSEYQCIDICPIGSASLDNPDSRTGSAGCAPLDQGHRPAPRKQTPED